MTIRQTTYRLLGVLVIIMAEVLTLTAQAQDRPRAERRRGQIQRTDSLAVSDSIQTVNLNNLAKLNAAEIPTDSLTKALNRKVWIPNPTKATWLALVIPGGGQIYNRKYWKLPIFYGGFVGCTYALTWNNRMYKDYADAYKDAVNDKWDSSNITDLLPASYLNRTSHSQITDVLKRRKDMYRRYRDISIFAFIGVYALSIVDAYVDAELSNFDISPDLSMHIEPALLNAQPGKRGKQSVGLQCSITF